MNKKLLTYQAELMAKDHAAALTCKRHAVAEVQKMSGLQVMPRTNWEAHKWIRIELGARLELIKLADELISTEQLYQDLDVLD